MLQKDKNILRRGRELYAGRRGDGPVVYWMERDQRLQDNWSLLYAQQEALIRKKALLIVLFSPPEKRQKSGQRNFQLIGLAELFDQANIHHIGFHVIETAAENALPSILNQLDAHLLVTDFSPLQRKKKAITKLGRDITLPLIEVDSHNIIPCWTVSDKKEYAAYTLRPKIHRLLDDYLTDFPLVITHPFATPDLDTSNFADITPKLGEFPTHARFPSGNTAAMQRMKNFVRHRLQRYDSDRNDPLADAQSELSPYLHCGQLSPQRLALTVSNSEYSRNARESFLEELIVRRELADNFCYYEPCYDVFRGFPDWARTTLDEHRSDQRQYSYTTEQFENARTHEQLWNSCQIDLANNNKLHGFLRMYWAKKILEWSNSPQEALATANHLNDTYSIDGNDPNGYAGTAWSIGGVHDRAWQERMIFGKIRYMNENGCRRKFDVDRYIREVES